MIPAPQLSLIPSSGPWVILTTEEVMERTGWSRATFFRRRTELISRATASGTVEYLESALPSTNPSQIALVVPAAVTLPLFANQPPSLERVVLPDPADQAQADKRLAALEPLLDFPNNPDRYAALQVNGKPVNSLERMIAYSAQAQDVSARTLKRWLARYRAQGFTMASLADRIRADKGQSRWFNCHREAQIFAAYLYLVERMSVTFVCEQIEYETAMLGLDNADLPSRETVRFFLSENISPAMRTLARDGQRIYRERMAPYVKRGYVDVFSNQVWVGDHAIHDVEIQNDLFEEVPFGTPGRLRMSAFVDYRSRKAWATWAWEGSSRSIAATMLRAMLEVGPPEGIYVDNGKDYKKVAKGATSASEIIDDTKAPEAWYENEYQRIERTGLLARLGIAVTHCIPRHPQSKHVERFFRTMHTRFDAVHSTYTSGSPFTRPESTELAMMRHRRLLKTGRVEESNHPTASRFILGCLSWIREYNATPQTGEGMDGHSPDEIFATDPNPNQKPVPNPETLALLLAEFARRGVRECAVQLNKHRYTPRAEDRMAWAAMHEANDGEVLVGYNPDDPEFAVALTLDGRFLAWLEAEPLIRFAPNDPKTQAQIAQSMATRRGLEKAAKSTLRTIEGAARSMGAKSAEEMLYGRLQFPTNTSAVITQRKRLRPNKEAVAPSTAADIANNFLEGLK